MSSKLRDALEKADTVLSVLGYDANTPIRTQIKQALAEPLKNCEVGTDLEQAKRLRNICIKYRAMIGTCLNCPIFKPGDSSCDCFARWSQMAYESEVK